MKKIILFIVFILIASNIILNFENINGEKNYNKINHIYEIEKIQNEYKNFIPSLINDEIDQNQSENSGEGLLINDEIWYSQSFIPSLEILTKVKIFLSKKGDISDQRLITFIIKNSLYRDNLFITSFNTSEIFNNGSWIEIKNINLSVISGNHYFIILRSKLKISDDGILWHYALNNPYLIGDGYLSENQGISWYKLDNQPQYSGLDFCFKTYGGSNHPPNKPLKPIGQTEGHYEKNYSYNTTSIDIDNNQLFYYWDWGDGHYSEWIGPYESGEICMDVHMWMTKGSYLVKVKTKDQWDIESEWSDVLTVKMEKRKSNDFINFKFYNLFAHFLFKNII